MSKFFNRVTAHLFVTFILDVVAIDKWQFFARDLDYEKYIMPHVPFGRTIIWRRERRERKHFEEESTHWLPRYAFPRSRKSVTPRLRTRSRVIYLLRRLCYRAKKERERKRENREDERAENVSSVMVGPLSTRFDASVTGASEPGTTPLNTPRCTCRGIIHCLYFPLPPSSHCSSSLIPLRPRVSISFSLFLSSSLVSLFARGEPSAMRSKGAVTPLVHSLLLSFIIRYRNSTVYRLSLTLAINPLRTFHVTFCCAIYTYTYIHRKQMSLELEKIW